MPEIHILVIPSWYPTAYSNIRGIFFKEQVHALSKNRIRVGVVYPDLRSMRTFSLRALKENYFQTTVQTEDGIPTIRYHGWSIPKTDKIRGARFIKLSEKLATKYIRKYDKPDIIHAHSILWGGCAAQHLHERFQIPYFVTEHSSVYMQSMIRGFQEPFIRKTIRDAHTVIAVSSSLADLIAPYAGGKEIEVIPNTIDTGYFSLPVHPRITKPFRFLTVAMLTPKKNVGTLIQAFARSFRGQEEVRLEIGGDGTERTSLEKLVAKEGLDSQIHFLGMLTRNQVRQAMWRANCFVLPSQVETFGVVLIEAMSTGLPVIATKCGGPEDFVSAKVGYLSDPGDEQNLSLIMQKARNKFADFDHCLQEEIRKYTVKRFSQQAVISSLLLKYNLILKQTPIIS